MVSIALAIVIITLFSTIYSWSMETYSTQKGIRRNDQRSRMMVTVIKGDLNNRSFKDVVPFWPGQRTDELGMPGPRYNSAEREGYFCISENDPNDGTDDVLFLTVKLSTESTQRWYTGRATLLRQNPPPMSDTRSNEDYLIQTPNQPEFDDGQVQVLAAGTLTGLLNNAGSSTAAEVAYFLRNGNLYRRVLLIREPYATGANAQPTNLTGSYFPNPAPGTNGNWTPTGSGVFWRDFSYSAYYDGQLKFHGVTNPKSFDNQYPIGSDRTSGTPSFPISLGIPPLRFGYSLSRTPTNVPPPPLGAQFLPREYVGTTFIGRFLTQETGHADFLYPGAFLNDDPMQDPHVRTSLTYDTSQGLVSEYSANIVHRGEDILMTNVHEFDVKVWDRNLARFVDLGHQEPASSGIAGEYHMSRNQRTPNFPDTGPAKYAWNRFDTWHPYVEDTTPTPTNHLGPPPYKSKWARSGTVIFADTATGGNDPYLGANEDTNGNGVIDPATELDRGNPGIDAEQPLLAIQITIRFFDNSTKQMRQLTIQHSLKK